jgi:hypothetical protein
MKLYKFRSFENFEFTLDIIMNERLYCAHHKDLNDPFEGLFSTIEFNRGGMLRSMIQPMIQPMIRPMISDLQGNYPQTVFKTLDELPSLDTNTRICSLSRSMADVRMWSLYASGHTGCVIEIELEPENEIVEVKYDKGLKHFKEKLSVNTKAIDVLSFKTHHWDYEKEYRIVTDDDFYSVKGKITGIYLGIRTQEIHREIVIRSTPKKIPVYETKIQESTVEIRPDKRVN